MFQFCEIFLAIFFPSVNSFKRNCFLCTKIFSSEGFHSEKNCAFSIRSRNYIICLELLRRKIMVNLITRIVSMEVVWRQCRE